MVARSVTDGRRLRRRHKPDATRMEALARADDDRLVVLTSSRGGPQVLTLDSAGAVRGTLTGGPPIPTAAELVPVTGGRVVVDLRPTGAEPSLHPLR